MKLSKGQQEVVTAVLIFGVVVSLVGATYLWGVPLIKKQQAFGNLERAKKFVIDLEGKIERIDNSQTGAKDLMIISEDGILQVIEPDVIEFTTYQIGTFFTVSDDPDDPSWNPIAWGPEENGIYGRDRPAIIRAKAVRSGEGYEVTYQIKFRPLIVQNSNNKYKIEVDTEEVRNQNRGVTGDQIAMENIGRKIVGDTTISTIKVTIAK